MCSLPRTTVPSDGVQRWRSTMEMITLQAVSDHMALDQSVDLTLDGGVIIAGVLLQELCRRM